MLDKMEVIDKPTEVKSKMTLKLEPSITSGNDVIDITDLSMAFSDNVLFESTDIFIKRGEKVAIIGRNGTGKTTLLKIITKQLHQTSGKVRLGTKVKIGYYDQASANLTDTNTIFEEISDAYPDLNNTKIRNVLAAFLFTGEDVFKKISSLSGGERGRVSLAKLMLGSYNFLILDEPTNHLDIESKEILEDALLNYEGTVLYVSHDRYFVNRTASRILELEDKHFTEYKGNYDYYIDKKKELSLANDTDTSSSAAVKETTKSKDDWKSMKEEQARLRKIKNDLKKTEKEIAELEALIESIDEEIALPENMSDHTKLNELSIKRQEACDNLTKLYETWEELAEENIEE
jgi:ATP-binding cassette subfamily F protein 3